LRGVIFTLEQEIASAIKFILDSSGNPAPYYWNVPQDFVVPSAYFPTPEIESSGDTLNSFNLNYSWYIKFFHKNTQSAHELAFAALTEILQNRNLIPLINEDGEFTGKGFRINDPELKKIDDGAVQLTLNWDSRRPYHKNPATKTKKFKIDTYIKDAYENALQNYNQNDTED